MPRRFHAEPMVRAIELLLQERMPRDSPIVETGADEPARARATGPTNGSGRLAAEPAADDAGHRRAAHAPAVEHAVPRHGHQRRLGLQHLPGPRRDPLARGRRPARPGASSSTCATCSRGMVWSAGYQPVCRPADEYEVIFAADKATFRRRDGDIETAARSHRLARAARRGPPGHADQPR